MATESIIEGKTIIGTVSGTALTVAMNIGSSDIMKTVVLAALGAVVSFAVTVALKKGLPVIASLLKRWRRQK